MVFTWRRSFVKKLYLELKITAPAPGNKLQLRQVREILLENFFWGNHQLDKKQPANQ